MTQHTPSALAAPATAPTGHPSALAAPAVAPAPDQARPAAPQTPAQPDPAPSADPASASPAERLLAAALAGAVRFYRVRADGTQRLVRYLPPDTPARETAEWVAAEIEDGKSVAEVAQDCGLSRASVRRALAAIDLATELEWDGGLADLYEDGVDAIYLSALQDPTNVLIEPVTDEGEKDEADGEAGDEAGDEAGEVEQ